MCSQESALATTRVEDYADVPSYVKHVFVSEPPPRKSCIPMLGNGDGTERKLFRLLGQILTFGIEHLHGRAASLSNLDATQAAHIARCFECTSWSAVVDELPSHPKALPFFLYIPKMRGHPEHGMHAIHFTPLD